MELLTQAQREQMLTNGRLQRQAADAGGEDLDFKPVVKIFTPVANGVWLLTEIDPEEPDRAFGLCDLGLGCPELGYVSLSELAAVKGPRGLLVERDLNFIADKTLSEYAIEARELEHIGA